MTLNPTCLAPDCPLAAEKRGYCERHYRRWKKHGDPLAGKAAAHAGAEWIAAHVGHQGDECLPWPFGRQSDGRGNARIHGERMLAHRAMCERAHGPAPSPDHEAAHSCGNGHLACCNPNHLRWATHRENHADRWAHGTMHVGEANHNARLSRDQVIAIRASAEPPAGLAQRFGVSVKTVSKIRLRQRWAWLPEAAPCH